MFMAMPVRDLIVLGSSAGGVEALRVVLAGLPVDLAAAVCIVQHVSPASPSVLPQILTRTGPLPATHAIHGEPIRQGRIYVAPPDRHLLVRDGVLELSRDARENGNRPSIDVLFRSAAAASGSRVIGVILTGTLDDGTAGLLAIKHAGGMTLVQDPATAAYPSMPASALEIVKPDRSLPLAEIGPHLASAAGGPAPASRGVKIVSTDDVPAPLVCPDCGGVMKETFDDNLVQFRCHTGHVYSPQSVLAGQAEAVERALWSAVRALEESAAVARRLADRARDAEHAERAARYHEQRLAAEEHARLLRDLLRRQAS